MREIIIQDEPFIDNVLEILADKEKNRPVDFLNNTNSCLTAGQLIDAYLSGSMLVKTFDFAGTKEYFYFEIASKSNIEIKNYAYGWGSAGADALDVYKDIMLHPDTWAIKQISTQTEAQKDPLLQAEVARLNYPPFLKVCKDIDTDAEKRFTLRNAIDLWFKAANRIHYSQLHPAEYPPELMEVTCARHFMKLGFDLRQALQLPSDCELNLKNEL